MKNLVTFLFVLLVILVLSACGSSEEAISSTNETEVDENAKAEEAKQAAIDEKFKHYYRDWFGAYFVENYGNSGPNYVDVSFYFSEQTAWEHVNQEGEYHLQGREGYDRAWNDFEGIWDEATESFRNKIEYFKVDKNNPDIATYTYESQDGTTNTVILRAFDSEEEYDKLYAEFLVKETEMENGTQSMDSESVPSFVLGTWEGNINSNLNYAADNMKFRLFFEYVNGLELSGTYTEIDNGSPIERNFTGIYDPEESLILIDAGKNMKMPFYLDPLASILVNEYGEVTFSK